MQYSILAVACCFAYRLVILTATVPRSYTYSSLNMQLYLHLQLQFHAVILTVYLTCSYTYSSLILAVRTTVICSTAYLQLHAVLLTVTVIITDFIS